MPNLSADLPVGTLDFSLSLMPTGDRSMMYLRIRARLSRQASLASFYESNAPYSGPSIPNGPRGCIPGASDWLGGLEIMSTCHDKAAVAEAPAFRQQI